MDKYDVIVVGAGLAGSAASYYLAKKGYDVLLVEKARVPGQRNVSGGVIYGSYIDGYGLIDLIPNFEKEAPLERRVSRYKLVVLEEPRRSDGEYRYRVAEFPDESFIGRIIHGNINTGHDYTVLRSKFDRWFSMKVVEAGGMLVTGVSVEDLIIENDRVVGVRTNKEEAYADLVIDASGVTSTLVIKAGLRGPLKPDQVYHGVKMIFKMDPGEINRRFGLKDDEGIAIAVMGDFLKGMRGGGFIYTNKDTLSVGLVVKVDSMIRSLESNIKTIGKPLDVLEEMISHPYLSKLFEDAEIVEYSAHNIPVSYRCLLEKPLTSGFLVAGDALGSFVKLGALIDGMRRAIATGIMAAKTYEYARKHGSFDESTLMIYLDLLEPIYKDVYRYKINSYLTEGWLAYGLGSKIALKVFGKEFTARSYKKVNDIDAIQKIQNLTGKLEYDEDKIYSHIKVNYELANIDPKKLWVPACPVNCYTIVVEGKGVFASFKDLYRFNLMKLKRSGSYDKENMEELALRETWSDIANAQLRFDHVACVACGTCWVIGPPNVIQFGHEREGHGVKFKYG